MPNVLCIYAYQIPHETPYQYVCVWLISFNFPLYVTVNECYLNKTAEAHKAPVLGENESNLVSRHIQEGTGWWAETGMLAQINVLFVSLRRDNFKSELGLVVAYTQTLMSFSWRRTDLEDQKEKHYLK